MIVNCEQHRHHDHHEEDDCEAPEVINEYNLVYEVLRGSIEHGPDGSDQRRPGIIIIVRILRILFMKTDFEQNRPNIRSFIIGDDDYKEEDADQASLVKMMMTDVEGSSLS